jgi:proteasome-associated ATPase
VGRPNREDCNAILKVYLKPNLPREHKNLDEMTQPFLNALFKKSSQQEVLVLTLRSGKLKKLYWKDFISGAIIEGVVKRTKEKAIERAIDGKELKIMSKDLTQCLETEFKEGNLLPAESNMEDWLQLLDLDPRHVVRVRRPNDSDQAASETFNRSII